MHLNKETLLSLIIPVYNEEENVQNAYEKIIEFFHIHNDIQYEIIFTDNCSEDRTFEIIQSLALNDDRIRAYPFLKMLVINDQFYMDIGNAMEILLSS